MASISFFSSRGVSVMGPSLRKRVDVLELVAVEVGEPDRVPVWIHFLYCDRPSRIFWIVLVDDDGNVTYLRCSADAVRPIVVPIRGQKTDDAHVVVFLENAHGLRTNWGQIPACDKRPPPVACRDLTPRSARTGGFPMTCER